MVLKMTFEDLTQSSVILFVVFSVLLFYFLSRRPKGLPPFPVTPLPIVGNLLSLDRNQRAQFLKWRQQQGDIFSLYMGSRLVVVLNGSECIKEAFVKYADVFSERPDMFIFTNSLKGQGIIATSGPVWKEMRTFALKLLRYFGFGRSTMEGKILTEVENVVKFIESKKGEKENFSMLNNAATSNVICSLVFGHRFDFKDETFLKCCEAGAKFAEANSNVNLFNFFPFLSKVPFIRNIASSWKHSKYFEDHLIKPELERHYEHFDGSTDDFISGYIKEIKDRENERRDTKVLKEHFTQVIIDLYLGGTETTATTLNWLVLFLILNPEVQERCFKEIHDNIGMDHLPTLKDKEALPYLQATILETQRRSSILPLGVSHTATCDTRFRGFLIPKDTVIISNLDSALLDPDVWSNPEEFKPERFLDDKGALVKSDQLIPFSVGRRVCLGKGLAEMELFLFGSALIQRFQFQIPEDEPAPSLVPVFGVTAVPKPYMARAIPRNL